MITKKSKALSHHKKLTGKLGEQLVCEWLLKSGFEIRARNFHCRYGEIDIVAFKDGTTHFVEVKTRTSTAYGHPLESVGRQKIQRMKKSIHLYRELEPVSNPQILIAAVLIHADDQPDIELILYEG